MNTVQESTLPKARLWLSDTVVVAKTSDANSNWVQAVILSALKFKLISMVESLVFAHPCFTVSRFTWLRPQTWMTRDMRAYWISTFRTCTIFETTRWFIHCNFNELVTCRRNIRLLRLVDALQKHATRTVPFPVQGRLENDLMAVDANRNKAGRQNSISVEELLPQSVNPHVSSTFLTGLLPRDF